MTDMEKVTYLVLMRELQLSGEGKVKMKVKGEDDPEAIWVKENKPAVIECLKQKEAEKEAAEELRKSMKDELDELTRQTNKKFAEAAFKKIAYGNWSKNAAFTNARIAYNNWYNGKI